MSDTEFDTALVTAAFRLAGAQGWRNVTVATAAREAGLSLVLAHERFPARATILLRFGRLADQAALAEAATDGSVRDRLFDLLMRRYDMIQGHRTGVKALLRFLPAHPPTALLLACATKRSMRWMLQAAGIPATGARGEVQVRGLLAVWLWGIRAWERDDSDDLSTTMAAVDTALQRAERIATWLHRPRGDAPPPPDSVGDTDPPLADPSLADPSPAEPPPADLPAAKDPPLPESEA
jgi:ubiquinone biosynthesis protein COQ9